VERLGILLLCSTLPVAAAGIPEYARARELYLHTEYRQSLAVLSQAREKDAAALELAGQNHYMLGELPQAIDTFGKALALTRDNSLRSSIYHWLGRAQGRRAETSSFMTAPGYASKARASFEEAVRLDPNNDEALNDLFDYYLQAPGFLGGGIDKAEALAQRIAQRSESEGEFAQAQVAQKRKQYDQAEQHFRRAAELEPRDQGRWIDLAKFLARRGKLAESDAMFDRAASVAPGAPQLMFARAEIYIDRHYRLDDAHMLLDRYLRSPLTPDDPPRERARALLEKIHRPAGNQ